MKEVKEGNTYICRTTDTTLKFRAKTEFIHRGQFVKIIAFDDLSERALIQTRLGESSEVRINELKPKATVFYDDIPVAESNTPLVDGEPIVGERVDGLKILRTKPVRVSTIVGYTSACETLDENLRFLGYPKRPFVFWCVEIG